MAIRVNSCLVKKLNNAVIVITVYISGLVPSESLVKWVNKLLQNKHAALKKIRTNCRWFTINLSTWAWALAWHTKCTGQLRDTRHTAAFRSLADCNVGRSSCFPPHNQVVSHGSVLGPVLFIICNNYAIYLSIYLQFTPYFLTASSIHKTMIYPQKRHHYLILEFTYYGSV